MRLNQRNVSDSGKDLKISNKNRFDGDESRVKEPAVSRLCKRPIQVFNNFRASFNEI